MKITDVRIIVHERQSSPRLGPPPLPLGVLVISTDEGIDGHTFVGHPGPNVFDQIIRAAKPLLIGKNPLDIGVIWRTFQNRRRMFDPSVQGYIDVALWDIAGKVAGLPIHRMLGTCRDKLATQASSWVHGDTHTYAEEAAAYKAQGIRSYKLHPPTQRRLFQGEHVPLSDDIEACALVREAVGEGYPLMLDSAWAYTYPDALKVGFAIEDLDFTWYEDPLPADDIYGYVRLKEQLSIPILATELTDGGFYALAPWILNKATDYLRGDVVIKGGITGMMKIARLAEAFHLNCEVHDAYNALNNVATLNVVMAIDNCDWFEIITIHEPGSYDFKHLSYGLADPITVDADGYVHAPTAPGLGHAIDWDLINSGSPVQLT
jgi:L-alanine-DL-glutamate epimerase-like enolase superfamily enzyme